MQAYRTFLHHDKRGGLLATQRDKAPRKNSPCPRDSRRSRPARRPPPDPWSGRLRRSGSLARARPSARRKPRNGTPFRRRRRSRPGRGRAEGQGRAIRCLPPAPGSLCSTPFCAPTRPPPGRCAPAWRCRAPRPRAKILRVNADEAALRDLRFAVGDPLGPAANLLSLWRDLRRPAAQPRPRPDRRRGGAARPGCADPNGLAASLKACAGQGDPVSAAAKAAAAGVLRLPGRPGGRSRNPRPLGRSTRHSPSGCAGRGPCR